MVKKAPYLFLILWLLSALLTGCVSTRLKTEALPPAIDKLSLTNKDSVALKTVVPRGDQKLGHQYLFVILPFGKIYAENLNVSFFEKARTSLALSGYNARPVAPGIPTIELEVVDFSLTAYDYFFIRKVSCTAEYQARVFDGAGEPKAVSAGSVNLHRYSALAFRKQLEHVYNGCLGQAVNQALYEVGYFERK